MPTRIRAGSSKRCDRACPASGSNASRRVRGSGHSLLPEQLAGRHVNSARPFSGAAARLRNSGIPRGGALRGVRPLRLRAPSWRCSGTDLAGGSVAAGEQQAAGLGSECPRPGCENSSACCVREPAGVLRAGLSTARVRRDHSAGRRRGKQTRWGHSHWPVTTHGAGWEQREVRAERAARVLRGGNRRVTGPATNGETYSRSSARPVLLSDLSFRPRSGRVKRPMKPKAKAEGGNDTVGVSLHGSSHEEPGG